VINEVKITIYFFLGRYDYQVASIVAEKFYNSIKAPEKELVWFEKSAHSSCFEEAEKFNKLMVDKVLTNTLTAQK
jgi:esterase/lipase